MTSGFNEDRTPALRRLGQPPAESSRVLSPGNPGRPSERTPAEQVAGKDKDFILAGIGCVLILFAGLLIAGMLALRLTEGEPDTAPSTQVAAVVDETTPTPEPTRTPTPTPRPPATPLPTWTPLPEAPSVADYRGYDAEYRNDVLKIGEFLQSSISEVNGLMQDPKPDDDMWAYKIESQVLIWQDLFAVGQTMLPPTQYDQFHLDLLQALARLNGAADDLLYAIDFNDPAQLNAARAKTDQGSQLLNDALTSFKSSV